MFRVRFPLLISKLRVLYLVKSDPFTTPMSTTSRVTDVSKSEEHLNKSSENLDRLSKAELPLQDLKLASHVALERAQTHGRVKCSKCGGSRMFFCYTCYSLVGVNQQEIPLIKVSARYGISHNSTDGTRQRLNTVMSS